MPTQPHKDNKVLISNMDKLGFKHEWRHQFKLKRPLRINGYLGDLDMIYDMSASWSTMENLMRNIICKVHNDGYTTWCTDTQTNIRASLWITNQQWA